MASKFELRDTVPVAPSGKINVKWQSDVSGNVSAYVDPAGGGGVAFQTPWLSDIDGAVFDLNNLGVIRFKDHLGVSAPITAIGNEGGTLHLLSDNGGSINIESYGTGRVMVSTDSTRRIVVRQDGNVGIGPSMNPSYLLDVQGDCNVEGVYRIDGVPIATGAAAQTPWLSDINAAGYHLDSVGRVSVNQYVAVSGEVFIGNTGGDPGVELRLDGDLNNLYLAARPSALNGAGLGIITGLAGLPEAVRMTVSPAGNVGIGNAATASPQELLHIAVVSGNASIRVDSGATGSPYIQLRRGAQHWWMGPGLEGNSNLAIYDATSARMCLLITAAGDIRLFLGGSLKTLSVDGSGFVKAA